MTKNNAKTILFGALIVAMILPVSIMDTASAQSTPERPTDIELLTASIVLHRVALSDAKTMEEREHLIQSIERLIMVRGFLNQENGMSVDQYTQLLTTYNGDDIVDADPFVDVKKSAKQVFTQKRINHHMVERDCHDRDTKRGIISSDLTVFFGSTKIDSTFQFPAEYHDLKRIRHNNQCNPVEFSDAWMTFSTIAEVIPFGTPQTQVCRVTSDMPVSNGTIACSTIKKNNFVLINSGNSYELENGNDASLGRIQTTFLGILP